ncbi:hypothetical protein ISS03_00595 [Patescibacteria group bacterium]|nr:hypothetical protein [Patescibacteria group bacterium]
MSVKKAYVLWCRISISKFFNEKVRECRFLLNIPKNGFAGEVVYNKPYFGISEYEKWCKKNLVKEGLESEKHPFNILIKFKNDIQQKFNYYDDFSLVVEQYLFLGGSPRLHCLNLTGCSLELVRVGETKSFKSGVYLRVGDNSNISDLKEFIKKNNKAIEVFQGIVAQTKELKNKKGIRSYKDFKRNCVIYELSLFSIEILRKISANDHRTTNYKDIIIADIMKESGYKLDEGNVRKIISEQRKIRNDV